MPEQTIPIYIGTDPRMEKANIALEYSIKKHASKPVEIHWMDYSRGGIWANWDIGRARGKPYSDKGWATEFTCFRFAIPEANNFEGRAIYLDADMILLRDIYEMFTLPMQTPVIIPKIGYDVMLIDCEKFKDKEWWPSIEEMKKSGKSLKDYHNLLMLHRFVSPTLPEEWDCCDGKGFDPEKTGLVHYTNMRTQPWKPYPEHFDYPEHSRPDMVELFWDIYNEALEAKKE